MFEKFIEETEKILLQYREGAIFAEEAFNAIVARAVELSNTDEYIAHFQSKVPNVQE